MTKIFNSILSITLIIAMLVSCRSAKNLYENGNYYEAVIKSADKLRNNPDHKKTREALRQSYPLAVEELEARIAKGRISNPDFANTYAVDNYSKLENMYVQIRRSPGALKVIPNPQSYAVELADAKQGAAGEQYSAGVAFLNKGGRENAKTAYGYFQMTNSFAPNYRDVQSKINESYDKAILKVLTQLRPVSMEQYKLSGDFFYDQVVKVFREVEGNEFIRFYTSEEANRIKLDRPDQVMTIEFIDFSVGDMFQQERIEKVERDSVVVGSVELEDGSNKKVYGTVSAKLTINRMEVVSKGRLRINIQDEYSGASLTKEVMVGEHVWFNEWGNFNGDERALNQDELDICNKKMVMPPPAQDLFIGFTKPIHGQLRNLMIRFYNGY
ncbi:MAG: hypothetical protein OCD76_23450 [Reichenbachiella sp.]